MDGAGDDDLGIRRNPQAGLDGRQLGGGQFGRTGVALEIPGHLDFRGGHAQLLQALPIQRRLDEKSGHLSQKKIGRPREPPQPSERAGGDAAVDHQNRASPAAGLAQETGPVLRLGQDKKRRPQTAEDAADAPAQVEGNEKDVVDVPDPIAGQGISGLGQDGKPDFPAGMGLPDFLDQVLKREDLAHGDGVDPDERPAAPGNRPDEGQPLL
ncbi:MAG: hypothetical protein BWX98_02282 [Candidatus Aminicenantes bacterium ADurb.Bin147]|nr:MAG: hypothetical protein BWX98_02282 [Candidatus Aminicenantes bacterium ADurb.Bin147]